MEKAFQTKLKALSEKLDVAERRLLNQRFVAQSKERAAENALRRAREAEGRAAKAETLLRRHKE